MEVDYCDIKTEQMKSKGVSLTMENKNIITFNSYKKIIDNQLFGNGKNSILKTNMMDFKKSNNNITTQHIIKDVSFNPKQFKRHIIKGTYETLPFGHKNIPL